jgi:uncharacterized surface protein with fasciclin (FAS1) repeats
MKHSVLSCLLFASLFFAGCNGGTDNGSSSAAATDNSAAATQGGGQEDVQDSTSKPNIVQIAEKNADFSTLVKAVQAADLVRALSNAGPFTVFAPTNEAFAKLPAGTLDDLLKPENKQKLVDILSYHTYVGVLNPSLMQDGQQYGTVLNNASITITKKGDSTYVNGNAIVATVPAVNGLICVINGVLLPPSK